MGFCCGKEREKKRDQKEKESIYQALFWEQHQPASFKRQLNCDARCKNNENYYSNDFCCFHFCDSGYD
jgi:hypothetical protein